MLDLPRFLSRQAIAILSDLLQILTQFVLCAWKSEHIKSVDRIVLQVLEDERVVSQSFSVELFVDFQGVLVTMYNETARSLETEVSNKLTEHVFVLVGLEVLTGQVEYFAVKFRSQVVCNE